MFSSSFPRWFGPTEGGVCKTPQKMDIDRIASYRLFQAEGRKGHERKGTLEAKAGALTICGACFIFIFLTFFRSLKETHTHIQVTYIHTRLRSGPHATSPNNPQQQEWCVSFKDRKKCKKNKLYYIGNYLGEDGKGKWRSLVLMLEGVTCVTVYRHGITYQLTINSNHG